MNRLPSRGAVSLAVLVLVCAPAGAGEIKPWFPADKPEADLKTRWRIVWGIENHAGGSEVLFIKEAHFQRGPGEPEIKVLDDCRLAEIFVPYNRKKKSDPQADQRIYDISGATFSLVNLDKTVLGPRCIADGTIYDRVGQAAKCGPVAVEIHDGQVRWMSRAETVRRGQAATVWAALNAANYRYIMLYEFRDDGSVGFRLGATAENLYDSDGTETSHIHTAWWRLNVALGDSTKTKVSTVATKTATAPGTLAVDPVLKEVGVKWVPEEFTRLRVESTVEKNKHNPAHFIGYDLISAREGSARYFAVKEEFTQNDFWVTRASGGEMRPIDVPTYAKGKKDKDGNDGPEDLDGQPITIWHQTALLHVARDEDFGPTNSDPAQGVALTVWAGCDLKPRNFFPKTPLYP